MQRLDRNAAFERAGYLEYSSIVLPAIQWWSADLSLLGLLGTRSGLERLQTLACDCDEVLAGCEEKDLTSRTVKTGISRAAALQ